MHAVIVTSEFFNLSSSERGKFAKSLAEYLERRCEKVTILFSALQDKSVSSVTWQKNAIVGIEQGRENFSLRFLYWPESFVTPEPLQVSWQVANELEQLNPDLIYFLDYNGAAYYSSLREPLRSKSRQIVWQSFIEQHIFRARPVSSFEALLEIDLQRKVDLAIERADLLQNGRSNDVLDFSLKDIIFSSLEPATSPSSWIILKGSKEDRFAGLWSNFLKSLAVNGVEPPSFREVQIEDSCLQDLKGCSVLFIGDVFDHKFKLMELSKANSVHLLCEGESDRAFCNSLPNAVSLKSTAFDVAKLFGLENGFQIRTIMNEGITSKALISVCLIHKDRPAFLQRALESLNAQTSREFEVIVVDDGSNSAQAIQYLSQIPGSKTNFPMKVFSIPNGYLGRARNFAAQHANGEYLLFMDDDNFALPSEIEVFAKNTREYPEIELFTCLFKRVHTNDPITGNETGESVLMSEMGLASLLLRNWQSDANFLVKKGVFLEQGGFSEVFGLGHEDWEFLLKCEKNKVRKRLISEFLFLYRSSTSGMLNATGSQSRFRHLLSVASKNPDDRYQDLLEILFYANRTQAQ